MLLSGLRVLLSLELVGAKLSLLDIPVRFFIHTLIGVLLRFSVVSLQNAFDVYNVYSYISFERAIRV